MKKDIIIGLLTIGLLLSLTYGVFQKIRADRIEENISRTITPQIDIQKTSQVLLEEAKRAAEMSALEAEKQRKIAEEQKKIAEQQRIIAEKNAAEAIKQKKIADEQKRILEISVAEAKKAREAAEKIYNEKLKK